MTVVEQLDAALAGRYAIVRQIGAGGMATVYLARDLKHARDVALKVLRPELSAVIGAERFLAEIRTTANLQHPHILPLHDSGEAGGVVFYVMPFVEGESLRDRLSHETQLPVDDAVRIAREVASALDYAHRHGVVHRDIKPENILLHDGQALVADFGIALAVSAVGGGARMTETGMSLGTPHYMSPEQAMGEREITPRSDVYALGCVLYEMLLGEPPFTGPTAQAIVARVVTEEPRSLTAQRKTIPANVEAAVHTALAKLPADRFASAKDFADALAAPGYRGRRTGVSQDAVDGGPRWILDRRTLLTFGAAATLVAAALILPRGITTRPGEDVTTRLRLVLDDSTRRQVYRSSKNGPPAVSADGRIVAYSVTEGDTVVLRVQPLDRFDPWTVDGGGRMPFFSPDGRWIGFLRGGVLWKVPTSGGPATRLATIAEDAISWGLVTPGVWLRDEEIYFVGPKGLLVVPAAGGEVRQVALKDSNIDGGAVYDLGRAPDGRLLAAVLRAGKPRVALVSTDGRDVRFLPADVLPPASFIGTTLVFAREGQRYASALDLSALRLTGESLPLSDAPTSPSWVPLAQGSSTAWFDGATNRRVELVWVDRKGAATLAGLPAGDIRWPRLSPDGRRLAFLNVWPLLAVADLGSGAPSRLLGGGFRTEPVWYHDGTRLITGLQLGKSRFGLATQTADGSRSPDTLITSNRDMWPTDVSPGDSLLLFYGTTDVDQQDVQVLHLRTKQIRRIPMTGEQRGARFSPDMRWIALQTRERGARYEVIVVPWPLLDARYAVSSDGGEEPVWSRDGRELYFRHNGHVLVVKVGSGAGWSASPPSELPGGAFESDPYGDQSWDVAPDGRFLLLRTAGQSHLQVRVIQNWAAELRRRLAASAR